jgi:hypothetical protein
MRRIKWNNPLLKFNSVIGVCIVFIFLHGVHYGNPVGSLKVDRTQSRAEQNRTMQGGLYCTQNNRRRRLLS